MTPRVPWLTLLPGGRTGPKAPAPRPPCAHPDILIDVEAGIVECDACRADLDPYLMLARYADEETRLDLLRRQIQADLAQGVLACSRCGAVPRGGV